VRLPIGLLLAALVSGCPAAPPRADAPGRTRTEGADGAAFAAPALPLDASAEATLALARFHVEEGCARSHRATGDLVADLAAVGRVCARGLVGALPDAGVLTLPSDGTKDIAFSLEPETCWRAIAVAERPGVALLIRQGDRILSGASSLSDVVAVGPDGPVCVREGGRYRLVVSVRGDGPSKVAVQVWRSARDAHDDDR
jgi:hypothetical protein